MLPYRPYSSFASFQVNYSRYGNMYVSGSSDGSIKVWDGASNKCSLSFNRAHEGEEICSVLFSKNGKVYCSFIGFNVM